MIRFSLKYHKIFEFVYHNKIHFKKIVVAENNFSMKLFKTTSHSKQF
jgi:hypothetical protein